MSRDIKKRPITKTAKPNVKKQAQKKNPTTCSDIKGNEGVAECPKPKEEITYNFKEGNEFWKQRSKHGRDKIFAEPQILWDEAVKYFQWCDKNPLKEQKTTHYLGNIKQYDEKKLRAYTLIGLSLYLNTSSSYLRTFKYNLKGKTDKTSLDFLTVIEQIEETIYEQKFTGAAANMLNHNIIARDLGLIDRKDMTTKDEKLPPATAINYAALSDETLEDLINNTEGNNDEEN